MSEADERAKEIMVAVIAASHHLDSCTVRPVKHDWYEFTWMGFRGLIHKSPHNADNAPSTHARPPHGGRRGVETRRQYDTRQRQRAQHRP